MGQIICFNNCFNKIDQLPGLIVYCTDNIPSIFEKYSISLPLAEKLHSLSVKSRSIKISQCLKEILYDFPNDVVLTNVDILFNPNYEIDVLKMLITLCKAKPFALLWPGTIEENKLVYAEYGYKDFKSFEIDDYDITCII